MKGGFFRPRDPAEHERAGRGYDVPDYCAHCGRPFLEHRNGVCPDNDDEDDEE